MQELRYENMKLLVKNQNNLDFLRQIDNGLYYDIEIEKEVVMNMNLHQ